LGSLPVTAALTLGLTGPFRRQGADAARGVQLWAQAAGVGLTLADDRGAKQAAAEAYAAWVGRVDLLLGPYSSGLVRAVAPLAARAGRLLWNHGGAADDLAQPGVVCLPAPASSYFHGAVDEALARHAERVVVVQDTGPFARAVAAGAATRAAGYGLDVRVVDAEAAEAEAAAGTAFLVAGRFDHDAKVVRRLRERSPVVLGAVAAGIPAFGQELGPAAEGVLGPVQWWPAARTPEVGPSGAEFARRYQQHTGQQPSYVAAQAAAAGYLAHAALQRGLAATDVARWTTSTLLGRFALDAAWRQVGHRATTVRWQHGRMVPLAHQPTH
jgi:ABC-type branched-subunit amino acid transport system substrate-binding protein